MYVLLIFNCILFCGRQIFLLLVLPDSTEIGQKQFYFIFNVSDDRHNVHTGSWSGAATFW